MEIDFFIVDDDAGGQSSGISDLGVGTMDCTVRALALMSRMPDDDPGEAYRKWYEVVVSATRRHYEERCEVPPTGIEQGTPPELYDTILLEHGFEERSDLAGQPLSVLRREHDGFIVHQGGHACAVLKGKVWDYFGDDPPYDIHDSEVLEMTQDIIVDRLFTRMADQDAGQSI